MEVGLAAEEETVVWEVAVGKGEVAVGRAAVAMCTAPVAHHCMCALFRGRRQHSHIWYERARTAECPSAGC